MLAVQLLTTVILMNIVYDYESPMFSNGVIVD